MAARTLSSALLLVLFTCGLLSGTIAEASERGKGRRATSDEAMAPAFSVRTLNNRTLTDESLRGKVVLLDFWATWCGPCIAALPEMERLSQKMADEPFVLVSISTDRNLGTLEVFLAKQWDKGLKAKWPQVWDGPHELAALFGVRSYPTYILIDADGRIVHRDKGWGSKVAKRLSDAIKRSVREARDGAAPSD